jgi:TRAP-type mannitol/chloroaromatic compound transport system permease small subunit
MKDYFYLQYQMTQRRLLDAGIHPLIGYLLSLVAFVLVSVYIFHKSEFAKYLVVLICISLQLKLSEKNRADFLLTTFGEQKSKLIRIVENLVLSVPFVVILIYNKAFPECIFITATAFINAAFSFHTNLYFSLPTPFSKAHLNFR